jgi:hypothetical protein
MSLLALAGCGWINGSAPPPTPSHTPAATHTPAPVVDHAQPAWVKDLGAGVVVHVPAKATAGHSSAGAAIERLAQAFTARHPLRACGYYVPAIQSLCHHRFAGAPASSMPTVKSFAIGFVAVRGRKALVGTTGTSCLPVGQPACVSNTNPAAVFESGKSFSALWTESIAAANSPVNYYSLVPCVRIGGRWYVFASASG